MKVILTGATGAAGLPMLRALLADDAVTHVTTLTRRPLPSWIVLSGGINVTSDPDPKASPMHPKLTAVVHPSFLSYSRELFVEHDACLWALGASQIGKTEAEYTELTLGYVQAFLDGFKKSGRMENTSEKPFRFLFVSGEGADQTEKSGQMFARIKGRTEKTLLKFAKESNGSFKATIIRPGYFYPSPTYPLDAKNQRGIAFRLTDKLLGKPVAYMFPSMYTPVNDMAKFAVEAAKGKWENRGTLFPNAELRKALKEEGMDGVQY